jgi:hypothetical protein
VIELIAGFKIGAPAERVWKLVNWDGVAELCSGTFFRAARFSPGGPQPGARRVLTPADDGAEITELLLHYDEELRIYGYRVVDAGDLPLGDYEGRISVVPAGPTACLLSFSARGVPVGITEAQLRELYQSAERQIAEAIARRLGAHVLN